MGSSRKRNRSPLPPVRAEDFVSASSSGKRQSTGFVRRYCLRSLEVFLYWMPVWVPLILLAQIGTRGLRPARTEEQRLEGHRVELNERHQRDQTELEALQGQLEALDDDIYLERLRRQRVEEQKQEIETRGLAPLPIIDAPATR